MVDVVRIETDRRYALTRAEFEQIRAWAGQAPESHFVDEKGAPRFQTTIPSQWLRCLLATIEHGYRDPKEDFHDVEIAILAGVR